MELDKDLLNKAKDCKSEEELKELAKENHVDLSEEEIGLYYEKVKSFNKKGQLADDELNAVSGGCGSGESDRPLFSVGDKVTFTGSDFKTKHGTITRVSESKIGVFDAEYWYSVTYVDNGIESTLACWESRLKKE